MLLMESTRMVLATAVAGLLLSVTTGALCASEVICSQKPVKPIQRICGIVIDQSGAPVAHVKVTMLKGETELVAVETGDDGKFSFDGLNAGSYDVQAQEKGFHTFRFPIVLVKPGERCKRALEVELIVGGEACSGVRLVKPKEVERRLHVSP
jgi:Carboxypeptidase regulatory-like domain